MKQRKTPRAKALREVSSQSSSSQESTASPDQSLKLASIGAVLAKMKQSHLARLPSDGSEEKTQSPPTQPTKGMSALDKAIAAMRAVTMPEMKWDDVDSDSEMSQVSFIIHYSDIKCIK